MRSFKSFALDFELDLLESFFDEDFQEFIGGEIEPVQLDEKARSKSSGLQPWAGSDEKPSASSSTAEVKAFVDKHVLPAVKSDMNEYSRLMKKTGQVAKNSKVLIDQKKPKSILSKIKRGKDIDKIHDIIRGAILTKDMEGVEAVRKAIRKNFRIWEEEIKKFGSDKTYGYYGSIHYKVELSKGNIAEIQVMPKSLWNTKAAAHKIYEIERDKIAKNPEHANSAEFKSQQKASRDLFRRGMGNKKVGVKNAPNITRDLSDEEKEKEKKLRDARWARRNRDKRVRK